jgi:hypothetical protein
MNVVSLLDRLLGGGVAPIIGLRLVVYICFLEAFVPYDPFGVLYAHSIVFVVTCFMLLLLVCF